jgi:hypothetical protein
MKHTDLNKIAISQMEKLGTTPAELAKKLKKRMTNQTVYNFMTRGKGINTKSLCILMEELGLVMVPDGGGRIYHDQPVPVKKKPRTKNVTDANIERQRELRRARDAKYRAKKKAMAANQG